MERGRTDETGSVDGRAVKGGGIMDERDTRAEAAVPPPLPTLSVRAALTSRVVRVSVVVFSLINIFLFHTRL